MFQIDDNFLASLGLAALPQEEKEKLKAQIYEMLEMRVGMRLASQMSDQQLTEFEGFMSGDVTKSTDYLARINPNWQNDPAYTSALQQAQQVGIDPNVATSEYAALKWLETNFPDYKTVVAEELDKLKEEISQAAPQILAEVQPNPNVPTPQPGQPQVQNQHPQPAPAQENTQQYPPTPPQQ